MSKVVSVFQKERRRDLRRSVRFEGLVNDGPVTVVDISASGVGAKVLGSPGPVPVGTEGYEIEITPKNHDGGDTKHFEVGGEATLALFKDGDPILSASIEIVRFDKEQDSLGARFINIEDAQYRIIERLVTGRPIKK